MMREASLGGYLRLDLKSSILQIQYLPLASCHVQPKLERNTLLWFFFQHFPEDKEVFEQRNPHSLTYWWNQDVLMSLCLFHATYLRFIGICWSHKSSESVWSPRQMAPWILRQHSWILFPYWALGCLCLLNEIQTWCIDLTAPALQDTHGHSPMHEVPCHFMWLSHLPGVWTILLKPIVFVHICSCHFRGLFSVTGYYMLRGRQKIVLW